jgi:hypothetical protein
VLMQDIREDPILLELWREMLCDMMPLMCHIDRATMLLEASRDLDDTHSSSSSLIKGFFPCDLGSGSQQRKTK